MGNMFEHDWIEAEYTPDVYADYDMDGEEFADSLENRRGIAHEMAMMAEWRRIKNRKHQKERRQRRRLEKLNQKLESK